MSNGVLVAVGGLLIAHTVANLMAAATPREPSLSRAPLPAAPERSWADRQVILDRNLFASSTMASAPPRVQREDIEESRLPVTLLGTFAANEPSLSRATLHHRESKETLVVAIGDEIDDQALVMRIERGRVLLRENGALRELALDESDQADSALSRVAPDALPGRPAAAATGDPQQRPEEPPLADVERTILDALAGQARVIPQMEDDELVGLHVSAIQQGSRVEKMGIEEGDVITQFNGISIGSPAEALRAAQEMLSADGFYVLTRRDDDVKYLHGRWDGAGS